MSWSHGYQCILGLEELLRSGVKQDQGRGNEARLISAIEMAAHALFLQHYILKKLYFLILLHYGP